MALRLPPLPLARLVTPPDVIQGSGAASAIKLLDAGHVAVFTRHAPDADRIRKILPDNVSILQPSWNGEPRLESIGGSIGELDAARPDWIVAVGGGSVIDGARLAWLLHECPHLDLSDRTRRLNVPRLRTRSRFCAIPTTAGSGAEASPAVVFEHAGRTGKAHIASPELVPDLVLLDPRFGAGLPVTAMAASALDAFTHAVEGFTSQMRNRLVDGLAVDAARRIHQFLPRAIEVSNDDIRSELLLAAFHAGLVQAHRTPGLAHAIAHQLGMFGVPHGLANAILLPHVIRVNSSDTACAESYRKLATISQIGGDGADLAAFVEMMIDRAGLPRTLGAAIGRTCDRTTLDQIAAGALADPCARTNAVLIDHATVTRILENAW